MDFFDSEDAMEKYLRQKCANACMPFSGGIELLPDCNMDCRFCYVHQNKTKRREEGELLSAEKWNSIIDQAFEMGVYSLLFTGGEPLLHPEFKKIYAHAAEKGFALLLNSNGTLMNEEWIEFFCNYGCRRMNISLYGTDNETYEKLCGYPKGYDRVIHNLQLLKDRGITVRISVSVTPQNAGQIDQLQAIADDFEFPIQFSSYMFPGSRRGINAENQYRLSPEEAAKATVKCFHMKNPQADYEASCRYSLSKLINPTKYNNAAPGFMCYAGKSDFWISWNGEMRPCGMFGEKSLSYSLLDHSFEECWKTMTTACRECSCTNEECRKCNKRDLCQICPASSFAETGSMAGKPEYLCHMTDHIIEICKEAITDASAEKPLVSIVIPVYNVANYISQCIESFLKQKLTSWEIILVDDGSDDGSGILCDQYAAQNNRIKVIHQPNLGVSAARNKGIELASADYITFCDSDDFVEPDFCRILYHTIKNREDTFIIANTWTGRDSRPREFIIGVDYADSDHITIEEARDNDLYAFVWNKIYSRKVIMEHNLRFDENCSFGEDFYFNEEYIQYCKEAAFIKEPVCVHLAHENGLAMKGLRKEGKIMEDFHIENHGELKVMKIENR